MELVKGFFDLNRPQDAEEIFLTMDPPDQDEHCCAVFASVYFLFILYYANTQNLLKAGKIYKDFLTLMKAQISRAQNKPCLTLVVGKAPYNQLYQHVSKPECYDLTQQGLDQLSLTLVQTPNQNQPNDHLVSFKNPVSEPEIAVPVGNFEDLLVKAAGKTADILFYCQEYGRLMDLYKTLDILPDNQVNRLNRANLILKFIQNFLQSINEIPLNRLKNLADEFFSILNNLGHFPEMETYQARAILSLMSLWSDDPKLTRTEKLYFKLQGLSTNPELSELKILGTWGLVSFYCQHGLVDEAYNLCVTLKNSPSPFQDLLADTFLICQTELLKFDRLEQAWEIFSLMVNLDNPELMNYKSRSAISMVAYIHKITDKNLLHGIFQTLGKIEKIDPTLQVTFIKILEDLAKTLLQKERFEILNLFFNFLESSDFGLKNELTDVVTKVFAS
jgi:hypothetical protein